VRFAPSTGKFHESRDAVVLSARKPTAWDSGALQAATRPGKNRRMIEGRRAAFFDAMCKRSPEAIAVVPSTPVHSRNNDVEHDFRQDSDLFYLTGFDEPHSVAVFDARTRTHTMFVRPRDPEREVWDGARAGTAGAIEHFGATEAFPITDLAEQLPKLLRNHSTLFYRAGRDRVFDDRLFAAIDKSRSFARTGSTFPTELVDPGTVVHEMRLFKSEAELSAMRQAAAITTEAHQLAMARTRPGMYEYEVEALLLDTFRKRGSERVAYGSIVGSGPNATVLHYRANNRKMHDGELLLIDAGCEWGYYASDVTRTFPVNGTFTKPQQALYELVLEAQLEGIELARPGGTLEAIHTRCVEVLTRGLVRLGILEGDLAALIAAEKYKPFYMHRTSHWLGMDVHDVGSYFVGGVARPLQPGMVLTIEPGIYIGSEQTLAPESYRGIGIRIEDDILVGPNGPVNLTAAIPKSVQELREAQRG
jgi:Xaa-Pro aminopeptidase